MATFIKLASGSWRAQVRRKGRYISGTFVRQEDARQWATGAERQIDRGATPQPSRIAHLRTFADLVDLYIADMKEVEKAPRRSKSATLEMLKRELGKKSLADLDRDCLIKFGRERAAGGAGPVALGMDMGVIRLVVSHAAAVHGLAATVEPVNLARIALKRLGLVGKSKERDRRPTDDELEKLFKEFDNSTRLTIPMRRIVKFAIATAMRQEDICRVTWDGLNNRTKMLTVRDRKDTRDIPLLTISGYDPVALIEEQRELRTSGESRIFPYNHCSVGAAFRRACREQKIVDLRFNDLRHEGKSRLFEAGFAIQQASLVTGHKDWKMLRRYTSLRPNALQTIVANGVQRLHFATQSALEGPKPS